MPVSIASAWWWWRRSAAATAVEEALPLGNAGSAAVSSSNPHGLVRGEQAAAYARAAKKKAIFSADWGRNTNVKIYAGGWLFSGIAKRFGEVWDNCWSFF